MEKDKDKEQFRDAALNLPEDDLEKVSGGTDPAVGGVVGGAVGDSDAAVHNCYNTGSVTTDAGSYRVQNSNFCPRCRNTAYFIKHTEADGTELRECKVCHQEYKYRRY